MSVENAIGLVLAVAVLAYLVYALLAPENGWDDASLRRQLALAS